MSGDAHLLARRPSKSRSWFYGPEHHDLIWSDMGLENPNFMCLESLLERHGADVVAPIPAQLDIIEGELQTVPKMPVDILYEVFSHLHPKDLLNLSRTTRSLRKIVTARHSRHMWKSSLAGVPALPSCPPDLTEIQYASLAFDDHCHFCLTPDVHEVFWTCRVRCCTKCIPKHFRSEGELELWIPEDVIIERPNSIFPYITSHKAYKTGGKSLLYFFPTAREYLRELDVILLMKDDDAFTKWIQTKKDIQTLRVSHAELCQYQIFQRPQPNHYEGMIILTLVLILVFLWKDHISMIL